MICDATTMEADDGIEQLRAPCAALRGLDTGDGGLAHQGEPARRGAAVGSGNRLRCRPAGRLYVGECGCCAAGRRKTGAGASWRCPLTAQRAEHPHAVKCARDGCLGHGANRPIRARRRVHRATPRGMCAPAHAVRPSSQGVPCLGRRSWSGSTFKSWRRLHRTAIRTARGPLGSLHHRRSRRSRGQRRQRARGRATHGCAHPEKPLLNAPRRAPIQPRGVTGRWGPARGTTAAR